MFDEALRLHPNLVEALRGRAVLHALQGQLEQALETFLRLYQLAPGEPNGQHNIATTLNRLERYAEAVVWFERSLAVVPEFGRAWTGLAAAREELGERSNASEAIQRALAINPSVPLPRLIQAMLSLPRVAESEEQSEATPAAFCQAMAALTEWADADPNHLSALGERVGDRQPFLLAYRPGQHRDLLSGYGDLIARAGNAYWSARGFLPMAISPIRARPRLGILCYFIRRHSVWDIIVKGLVRHLLRTRFELIIYHTGVETDEETRWAERHAERFVTGQLGLAEWLRLIREDAPDVLFFPEIGMDPLSCHLGALRLAPLQVASWGHPITTGLPEIDMFISGDLLEPPDAQSHYRERLVQLPGTGVCTEWLDIKPAPLPVSYLRQRTPGRVRLLLCQHPFKHDPADRSLLAEVLRACSPCELYVLKHRRLSRASDLAVELLRQTLAEADLDLEVLFVERPWVDLDQFLSLLANVDLYLDLPAFSGYTTAWQALHCGLPIVTLEGPTLRQRLAAGLLRQIGRPESIARNSEDDVAIAAQLAAESRDPALQAARRAELAAAAVKADHQVETVRAFEQTLVDALAELKKG
ncbi:O-linked N-acetylglucosamine transferase, SPINDLY family protein [Thiorhodovibrio litoralis]|uniref:O-linked N-acetylglucosamine transferase, SPINDLY family protein n=1 Tax=Thiorhodovibrio litoralis TaxID=2952932 RepID=UPI002B25D7C2|nr:hypothetical protein [Thiorhodovibrio litoralis]